MRRPSSLAMACVIGLVSTGVLVGVSVDGAAASERSIAKYHGERGPLATHAKTASASALPGPGDVVGTPELKSPEVEARENSPQGGSSVLNGKVRPPSAASVPATQS